MEISLDKHPAIAIKTEKKEHIQLNDLRLRLVLIPLFALSIPNLTGLIENHQHSIATLLLHYGYFLLIAIFIYQGNRFLLFKLREHFDWFQNPVRKIVALLLAVNALYNSAYHRHAPLLVPPGKSHDSRLEIDTECFADECDLCHICCSPV
jgi:hypothetical protein